MDKTFRFFYQCLGQNFLNKRFIFKDEEDPETVELELEKLKEEEKALRGKLQRTEAEHLSTQREIAKVKADVEHLKEHAPQLRTIQKKQSVSKIYFNQKDNDEFFSYMTNLMLE